MAMMLCAIGYAQDTPVKKMNNQPPVTTSPKMQAQQPDQIVMKDGRLVVFKNGKESDMKEDVIFGNGTVVTMDGTVKTKEGKTYRLNNGESIDANGTTAPIPGAKPPVDNTPPNPTPAVKPQATNPVTPPNR
ncbi:hypothetical protein EGI32_02705 [Ferruginibacter sp. HRS2-29]|nr:hypothetical protein [Ferruginibacter sp. HRS2-29]